MWREECEGVHAGNTRAGLPELERGSSFLKSNSATVASVCRVVGSSGGGYPIPTKAIRNLRPVKVRGESSTKLHINYLGLGRVLHLNSVLTCYTMLNNSSSQITVTTFWALHKAREIF
ncbi:hypothetical protein Fcan01_27217 [Folsomia candida]|uniref:Uncharacterized protein n=1 Tax=Folsomia candida TaxID=158441 RepID=A0A226CYL6_FOLCA|nr:hypothetical protein Fcan01_27217 [Folsomia candida]